MPIYTIYTFINIYEEMERVKEFIIWNIETHKERYSYEYKTDSK